MNNGNREKLRVDGQLAECQCRCNCRFCKHCERKQPLNIEDIHSDLNSSQRTTPPCFKISEIGETNEYSYVFVNKHKQ